ncbi:MAG: hypothetical protein RL715_605 [Chloroflexota bacterium]|jgi:molecular chaperone DnaK
MAQIFGLDLGTTNSVATFVQPDGVHGARAYPLTNRDDGRPHPSVVWYSGQAPVVGRQARDQMSELGLGVFGDVVRSPKVLLGSPSPIAVGGTTRLATDIVADILKFIRQDALDRNRPGQDFTQAVFSIPVSMHGAARRALRDAAHKAGLRVWQFVHEPLAALYGYLRNRSDYATEIARLEGRLALVFDWGGGTLDLTLCKFQRGSLIQVLNLGDSEVGGDQFDLRIRDLVRARHQKLHPAADWSRIQPNAEARLLKACEDAKIALSERETTTVFVRDVLAVEGPARDLEAEVTRGDLRESSEDLLRRGLGAIRRLVESVGVPLGAVEFCLATGGMVAMPAVVQGLLEVVSPARLRTVPNAGTIISEGAAWIAFDRLRLSLAKPLEILHANSHYMALVPERTALPNENDSIQHKLSLYCVDPRDGRAKCELARPKWPGRDAVADVRLPYGHLSVAVDSNARPFFERIELGVTIDHDLIAGVEAWSTLCSDKARIEVWDLEFGLDLPQGMGGDGDGVGSASNAESIEGELTPAAQAHQAGSVRVRSNITTQDGAWGLVPGEFVLTANPHLSAHNLTALQKQEKMYYAPCCECRRTVNEIMRDGCDRCASRGIALSSAAARARMRGHGIMSTQSV